MSLNKIYYHLKPIIPRRLQIAMRQKVVAWQRLRYSDIWPVDRGAGKQPEGWSGWPEGKRFALVLTHDVDTEKGHKNCRELIKLEEMLGFRSSFNFVPERYSVSAELRNYLTENDFEVGVHGLCHDGKYFTSKKLFQERAVRINHYLREWKSVGFRAPSMLHNLEWIGDLDIEYDASTFDTDPFEPHPDGVGTIFPFIVRRNPSQKGYVELPYTLPQDFTLFILMRQKNIDIWKQKLAWIVEKEGMVLLNTHPDYMNFNNKKMDIEEYPIRYYKEFLEYIKFVYKGQFWHVLPNHMGRFVSSIYQAGNAGKDY